MKTENYEYYKQKCLEELFELQDQFNTNYNLDYYSNWYYDHATGLFTFSKDDEEINFTYTLVSTYSRKDNTLQWGWAKHNLPSKVKHGLEELRQFGIDNNIEELNTALISTTEENAWALTAMAAKFSKGIMGYRPVSDHLLLFVVLNEYIEPDKVKRIKEKYIKCNEHKSARVAFVCQHLSKTEKTGFEEAFETWPDMELDEDDDLEAWCSECEEIRLKDGGWNDENMKYSNIKLVCEKCYFEMKDNNLEKG